MCWATRVWDIPDNKKETLPIMTWMFVSSPNSYVKAISPSGMVSGDGVFGRKLGLDEVVEEEGVSLSLPRFDSWVHKTNLQQAD